MGLKRINRIVIRVIIILLFIPALSSAQCKKNFVSENSFRIRGISSGYNHYYLNLIIQDIAISEQKIFEEISLQFSYKTSFTVNKCFPGRIEVTVMPFTVSCSPVIYRGYDISGSIRPESADLVFNVSQSGGFRTDSLIFRDFALNSDSALYTTINFTVKDTADFYDVTYGSAGFTFTKASYENFRDQILEIDNYFAASLLADSAFAWAGQGFLSEIRNRAELESRRIELDRIAEYINPIRFDSLPATGSADKKEITVKYNELVQLAGRYKAIIKYNRFYSEPLDDQIDYDNFLENFLNRLDHYYFLAYNSDFHYVNYIEGLSDPSFVYSFIKEFVLSHENAPDHPEISIPFLSNLFIDGLIERGKVFENAGNQLRALSYYSAAYQLADSVQDIDKLSLTYHLAEQMTFAIASSYLEISKRSALKSNPVMAAKYMNEAGNIIVHSRLIGNNPAWLGEYETWLYKNFEEQVLNCIAEKNFRLSMDYLKEIQSKCLSSEHYPCPENFQEWMRITREGLYLQLLDKALDLVRKEEVSEAEAVYGQSLEMRFAGGYRIDKDMKETKLELTFRQMHYEEFCEEATAQFNRSDYISALYYYNKADNLRKEGITVPDPALYDKRQYTARQVVLDNLSEGRVKVWANDFDGAQHMIRQIDRMISDYQFSPDDSLSLQFIALKESLLFKECGIVSEDYMKIMEEAQYAENHQDYILAMQYFDQAVKLSLENLKCKINDEAAWFGKIRLEPMARYQRMEKELDQAVYKSVPEYLDLFNGLRKYFNRNKLDKQGMIFIPLYDRVIEQKDSAFLTGMLNHYIYLTDYEHAFQIMKKIQETGYLSSSYKEQQKVLAGKLAYIDMKNKPDTEPWIILHKYTGGEKWFRTFSWNYKFSCLKIRKWNIKYWPIIWKK